jgi:formylglycine-generating enzyme required for sulfatase activity
MFLACSTGFATTVAEQNELLFKRIKEVHNLSDEQMTKIKAIFEKASYMGQGNPAITQHPATVEECKAKLEKGGVKYENSSFESICKDKYMAPLYNSAKEKPEQAKACIDQFEFPNIPCEYPVVWVKAMEAEQICQVMGKRMCDAHEWEGGCAGSLEEPDYPFELAKGVNPAEGFRRMRRAHNAKHDANKVWAYGPEFKKGICGQNSTKAAKCDGGNYKECGSNTYPTGFFPDCRSKLGVYDQHGNAAEHMNLPLNEAQMTSKGSKTLGQTEMKGSWFIWDKYQAHPDYCRWRAPYWHGSAVMIDHSHHNYHLGFRCCKTLP